MIHQSQSQHKGPLLSAARHAHMAISLPSFQSDLCSY